MNPSRILATVGMTLALTLAAAAQARAQAVDPPPVPGWTFTPWVSASGLWNDNVGLTVTNREPQGDYVSVVTPGGNLGYSGRRTWFTAGYRGSFSLYRDLRELNSFDQRANVELRRQLTRHVSLVARNRTAIVPTTDLIEVGGILFQRTGSRLNESSAGLEAALSERTTLTTSYGFQWIDFDRDDPLRPILRGGIAHRVGAEVRTQVSPRLTMGADYGFRYALIDQAATGFDIHTATAVVEYRPIPQVTLNGAAGVSRVRLEGEPSRTGPTFRVGVARDWRHAVLTAQYSRSFVPSFSFGGALENEELSASFRTPFARNRVFWQAGFSWHGSEPLTLVNPDAQHLESLWINTSIGFALSRWMRIEGFVGRVQQDRRGAGGRIVSNRIGFQVTASQMLRVQQ